MEREFEMIIVEDDVGVASGFWRRKATLLRLLIMVKRHLLSFVRRYLTLP